MNTDKVLQSDRTADDRTVTERLNDFIERMTGMKWFSYFYMCNLLIFLMLSIYLLFFSGSLFIEGIVKGWWRAETPEFEKNSLFLGFLYGFPSLLGFIGCLSVLSTNEERMFKFKVLFFVPAVIWSLMLVLDTLRYPIEYWNQWTYLIPAFLLCVFILFNVLKKVQLPYMKHEKGL